MQKGLVFIVEDNEMYSLMLEYTLANDRVAHCVSFPSGEECIRNLDQNPMLVILDYWLPGMNGMQTFEAIKKKKPDVPVVMLTRNKDVVLETEFYKKGVFDFFYKEEDSVMQIKRILNSVLDRIRKKENEESSHLKVFICILFIVAILTVIVYAIN